MTCFKPFDLKRHLVQFHQPKLAFTRWLATFGSSYKTSDVSILSHHVGYSKKNLLHSPSQSRLRRASLA